MPDIGMVARGVVATSLTTVYTVPANTKAYIKTITITNKTNMEQGVHVVLAGRYLVYSLNLPKYGGMRDNGTHVLEAGDTIQIQGSSTSMDYVIDLVEETA